MHLKFDCLDHFVQCLCAFLQFLSFRFGEVLLQNMRDTTFSDNTWQAEKHLLLNSMVTLYNKILKRN